MGKTVHLDGDVKAIGGAGDDYLKTTRDVNDTTNAGSSNITALDGDDTLEASTAYSGQTHMYAGKGDDTFILDLTNFRGHQGHHTYGNLGRDTIEFVDVSEAEHPVVGRLDDFDYSQDTIKIDGQEIDLMDLPKDITLEDGSVVTARVILYEQPELQGSGLGPQQILQIGDNVFYVLEGARDVENADAEMEMIDHAAMGHGVVPAEEERHFLPFDSIDEMRDAPTHQYVDPKNFTPLDLYNEDPDDMNVISGGSMVHGTDGDDLFHGGKFTEDDVRTGSQMVHGGDGNDILDGNTGNDSLYGDAGDDALAGGIDNDFLDGGSGNDHLFGGTGNDMLNGGSGNDHLEGGRGNDTLMSMMGDDTLIGDSGNDTYILTNPVDRDITIKEEKEGGFDRIETNGSFDLSRDAEGVEQVKLTGSNDADIIGNNEDNHITGNSGNNVLNGGDGDDSLYGWGGDDTLVGGKGNDTMGSNQGTDRFHFEQEDGVDKINDFDLEKDFITFSAEVDHDSIMVGETEDGHVQIFYDEESSIVLNGVTIDEFEEWALEREEGGQPIMVQEIETEASEEEDADPDDVSDHEHVHMAEADHVPAALEVFQPSLSDPVGDGGLSREDYDSSMFTSDDPGGYTYDQREVSEDDDFPIPLLPEDEEDEDKDAFPKDEEDGSGADLTCFVATAAYQDPWHPDVVWLRKFRDQILVNYRPGRAFIAFYWRVGPIMAAKVRSRPVLAKVGKNAIGLIVRALQKVVRRDL